MSELEEIIAKLKSTGVSVYRCDRILWWSGSRILVVAEDAPEDLLAHACAGVLEEDQERNGWRYGLNRRDRRPAPLPADERRANVQAAVGALREALATAGKDGMLLPDLRDELMLFRESVANDALRVLRAASDVQETRERRTTRGGASQPLIVLRLSGAANQEQNPVERTTEVQQP
jgi:hypothetical protein